jgi:hypothetical protein
MTPKREPLPEILLAPILIAVAAAIAIPLAILIPPPDKDSWLKWMLIGFGAVGILVALFERNPTVESAGGARAKALVLFLGPTGSRVAWAVMGGGFLGGGIAMFRWVAAP